VLGRRPCRPISIAEAVVLGSLHALDRSCWSALRTQHSSTQGPPARGPICAHSTPRLVAVRRLQDYRFALQKKQWLFPPPLQRESPPHTRRGPQNLKGEEEKADPAGSVPGVIVPGRLPYSSSLDSTGLGLTVDD
jgi:hypothetical protein